MINSMGECPIELDYRLTEKVTDEDSLSLLAKTFYLIRF